MKINPKRFLFLITWIAVFAALFSLHVFGSSLTSTWSAVICIALFYSHNVLEKVILMTSYILLSVFMNSIVLGHIQALGFTAGNIISLIILYFGLKYGLNKHIKVTFINIKDVFIITSCYVLTAVVGSAIRMQFTTHLGNISNQHQLARFGASFGRSLNNLSLSLPLLLSFDLFYLQKKLHHQKRKYLLYIVTILLVILLPLIVWIRMYLHESIGIIGLVYVTFIDIMLLTHLGGLPLGAIGTTVVELSIRYIPPNNYSIEDNQDVIGILALSTFVFFQTSAMLSLAAILCERDRVVANVEQTVQERTRELQHTLNSLKKEQNITKELSQDKTNFMAFLFHELRNPLHAIQHLALILKEQTSEHSSVKDQSIDTANSDHSLSRKADIIDTIGSYTKYMMNLVNDVLDVGSLSIGKIQLNPIKNDFHELIQDITHFTRICLRTHYIDLIVHFDECIPRYLMLDPMRYRQVLSNLVSNAVKHSPSGGRIIISFSVKEYTHDEGKLNTLIETKVTDFGSGIPKEDLNDVFKPYTQATLGTMKERGGSGLGLAIAEMIVKLMSGRIEVESEVGSGSTFWFTLPLVAPDIHKEHTIATTSTKIINQQCEEYEMTSLTTVTSVHRKISDEYQMTSLHYTPSVHSGKGIEKNVTPTVKPPPTSSYSVESLDTSTSSTQNNHSIAIKIPIHILIVDDSALNRIIMERILHKIDSTYVIHHAVDGLDAVEKVFDKTQTFSVIFMDIMMPRLDGYEASKRISEGGLDVPIIATTANANDTIKNGEMGVNGFLGKPFTVQDVIVVLKKLNIIQD